MFCPLHLAALDGNVKHAQKLLENGEDPNAADVTGMRPLHKASRQGHHQLCVLLLESAAEVDSQDDQGRTALYLASAQGHAACVSVLIEQKADCSIRANTGDSPLHVAITGGKGACSDVLIRHTDPSILDGYGAEGCTALHLAVLMERQAEVEMLMQCGASSSLLDMNGAGPLHVAVQRGYVASLESMLMHKADTNLANAESETALHIAASQGVHHLVRKLLLSEGVMVDPKDREGQTPLGLASAAGHLEVVSALLESGASLEVQDQSGYTPLMLAIRQQHRELGSCLLGTLAPNGDAEACLNLQDEHGRTVLHWASLRGETELLKQMVLLGGDTEMRDSGGFSALHCAAGAGHKDCAGLLFKRSKDVDAQTLQGMSAADVAGSAGFADLECLLRKKRENMSLLNATHLLEEEAAKEKVRREQRACKTAKEKERRARKKAAKRERQHEEDRKRAEEQQEIKELERLNEVRRREDVRRQRDKARPALISQVHTLMQQQQQQQHCQQDTMGFMASLDDHDTELTDHGTQLANHGTEPFESILTSCEPVPTEPGKHLESPCLAEKSKIESESVGYELHEPIARGLQTPPWVQQPHDASVREKLDKLGAGLVELIQNSPVGVKESPVLFEPIDAALMQCADAVGVARGAAPAGALNDVEQALAVCMDVISKESRARALNGGQIQGKSRLALWRAEARSSKSKVMESESTVQSGGEQSVPGTGCRESAPPEGNQALVNKTSMTVDSTSGFVPPKPRQVPRGAQPNKLTPGAQAEGELPGPKWQPYAEVGPANPRLVAVPREACSRTVHHNQQPNSSLPRPNSKECVFVPPAPKPPAPKPKAL